MLDTEARRRGAEKANETKRRRREAVEREAVLMRAAKKAGVLDAYLKNIAKDGGKFEL